MEEKRGFFKNVWTSIKDFEKYEIFAAENISKAIIYIVILTAIFTFAISLGYTYEFYNTVEDVSKYISENIEEIKVEDGVLTISQDEAIVIEDEENIIPIVIVDTLDSTNEEEYIEKAEAYDTGLILLSDKAIVVSSLLEENQEISYDNIFTENIENKDEILELISGGNLFSFYLAFALTVFIYMFIIYLTSNLIDAFVLGVLGYLFARIVKLRLKLRATFNIGVHSLTLPIILNLIYILVNLFTGFTISYFQWMYTTISYIYVVVAILMIKTEIINQKIQLIKLEKIQDKVSKEEAIEENPDKTEKKEEESKENSDEKEDTQTNGDEEPSGSNA